MKKTVKKIIAAFGIVACLILIIGASLVAKLYFEIGKMSSLETGEIVEGVFAVQDTYVNMFLIKAGDRYIAVDAGNKPENIKQGLDALKIDPQDIMAVFLTHSDSDHIAGLSLFKNAVIYLPKAEEQMINGQTSRFLFMKNKLRHKYELFEDNAQLNISGVTIKGISTPGHTPGAMCYIVNDIFLFTGDSMSLKKGKVNLFNNLFNMDSKTQQISQKRVSGLPGVKYIFTAHYGYTDHYQDAF